MYAIVENGVVVRYPYTVTDLRLANRDTSFPNKIDDETLLGYGLHKVFEVAPPQVTNTQILEELAPVYDPVQQQWNQVFSVRNMTEEELQKRNSDQADQIRIDRNRLLVESDWTQLPDVPQATKDLWAPYRQALRDMPHQSGFPTSIVWPTSP
jgi:hypothetical protein